MSPNGLNNNGGPTTADIDVVVRLKRAINRINEEDYDDAGMDRIIDAIAVPTQLEGDDERAAEQDFHSKPDRFETR